MKHYQGNAPKSMKRQGSTVQKMMQFDPNGAKYENFYRRVASVLSLAKFIKDNPSSGGDRERPGALLARRTRTVKLCSFDARSKGQPWPLP
jgi:hypothetical protein